MTHKTRLTGEEAWVEAFARIDHTALNRALGVDLDPELMRLALTHRSFANENGGLPNNERLEFLGDAVLGLSVAGELYERYPRSSESVISKMRAGIVSRYGCADVAREIGLGQHLLLGRGELSTAGRGKDSILADTVESLLGAVYRQHGFTVAREVVLRLFGEKIVHASAESRSQDWKTTLQERAARLEAGAPQYATDSFGPEHDKTFISIASVAGVELGRGTGHNKKLAEQEAARLAVGALADEETVSRVRGGA